MENNSVSTRATLIDRVKNQYDENSWNEFVLAYRPFIFGLIGKLGVELQDRDDISQRILIGLWEKLPEFEYNPQVSRFRTWLGKVIRNQVYSYFSRNSYEQKKRTYFGEENQNSSESSKVYEIMEKEWKVFISNLAWENIKDQFSEKTQDCFLLLSEGKSPQQVASLLDLDVSTIYVHKKRVLDKLYREISKLNKDLG